MPQFKFAEFQVRLLLCTPAGRGSEGLYWKCGCVASQCGNRKYVVQPCHDHAGLLSEVREQDEPLYDWITAPVLLSPSGPPA